MHAVQFDTVPVIVVNPPELQETQRRGTQLLIHRTKERPQGQAADNSRRLNIYLALQYIFLKT